jgi:aspartate racemase
MRRLGLIGGMSWESTAIYYKHMNEIARERAGGLHSAPLLLWSVDFAEIAEKQHGGDWHSAGAILSKAALALQQTGAEAIVLCTNTMHRVAEQIESAIKIPLIHIADATAMAIKKTTSVQPLLLATKFTMEQEFYRQHLAKHHAVACLIPDEEGRAGIHRVIYEELCRGVVRQDAKDLFLTEIARAQERGADGVILGCTEITMLLSQADVDLPVFDTTRLHCEAAMNFALEPLGISTP